MQPPNITASAMTLRDVFAAKAMASILARVGNDTELNEIAHTSYLMADEMLEARTRQLSTWPRLHTNTDFAKE